MTLDGLANARTKQTIQDALAAVGASCHGGKLVDAQGRGIRFIDEPCFGANPGPERMRLVMDLYKKKLALLQSQYTVIIIVRICM